MPVDGKYGRVTLEKGTVGEDEPVVVFRAQDRLLVPLLEEYRGLCWEAGSPDKHVSGIESTIKTVKEWQEKNHTQTPRSDQH